MRNMMKTSLLVVTAILSGCVMSWPTVQPFDVDPLTPATGEWRSTDNLIVVTDASHTQIRNATYPTAKALAQAIVAALPEAGVRAKNPNSYSVGTIGFGSAERVGAPLAPLNREVLERATRNLHPLGGPAGGTTPLHDVLDEAASELAGKRGRAAIVLLSDGLPDSRKAALDAGKRLVTGYAPGLCIHAVQTGDSSEGRIFLSNLSNLSRCGSVRNARAIANASDVLSLERSVMLSQAPVEKRALPPVAAKPDACAGRIVLRGVQFEFDKAEVVDRSQIVLDAAAKRLQECPDINITVDGHTCSIGAEQYNEALSQRRAESVRRYLLDSGVAPSRVAARGYGEANPIADNRSEDGRTQNRRVELSPR